MDKSISFYTQVLGLIVARKTTSPRGFSLVFLTDEQGLVELELVQLPGAFTVPEDLMHVAFAVTDISRFSNILTDGPTKTASGNVIGFLTDPDGYEIELIQNSK